MLAKIENGKAMLAKIGEDKNFQEQISWCPITNPYGKELKISLERRDQKRLHAIYLKVLRKEWRGHWKISAFCEILPYFVLLEPYFPLFETREPVRNIFYNPQKLQ